MAEHKCPECGSSHVQIIDFEGQEKIVCNECFYDETHQFEVFPEQRTNQKAKGNYSPYKRGGGGRKVAKSK